MPFELCPRPSLQPAAPWVKLASSQWRRDREGKGKKKKGACPTFDPCPRIKDMGEQDREKKGSMTDKKQRKEERTMCSPSPWTSLAGLLYFCYFLSLPAHSFPFSFHFLAFLPSFSFFPSFSSFYLSSPLPSSTHRPRRSSFFFAFFSFLPRVSFSFYSSAVLISSFPSSPLHCLCRSLRQFSFLTPLLSLPRTHTHTYLYNIPLPSSSFAFIRSLLQKNTSYFHTKKERSLTTNHVEDPCRQVPAPTRIVLCRPERTRSRAELGRARHNRPHRCPRQRNLPRRTCPVRSLSSDNQPSCLLMPWPLRAALSWTDQRTMFNSFVVGWHCSLFWTFVLTIDTFRCFLFVFFGEQ